jgi:hypothetical protein
MARPAGDRDAGRRIDAASSRRIDMKKERRVARRDEEYIARGNERVKKRIYRVQGPDNVLIEIVEAKPIPDRPWR